MAKIKSIHARQILDSRGYPTIEADVFLADGSMGRVAVPSGMSTGVHEALELRDNDPKQYNGKSVLHAINNIHVQIAPKIIGMEAAHQSEVDKAMIKLDGTENKSRLGANSILAVSLGVAAAEAKSRRIELFDYLSTLSPRSHQPFLMPHAMFNIINGGAHAQDASDIQEYMIVPKQSDKFSERLRVAAEIFHTLQNILTEKGLPTTVGDEGGFAPPVKSNTDALDMIMEAIQKAGYDPGRQVGIAMDMAASHFFKDGKYHLKKDNKVLDTQGMIDYCKKLVENYPIISLEDPLQEDDFEGWGKLFASLGDKVQIVGDDLYTTNVKRLELGIQHKASNAILIKPNQIGSLTETIEAIAKAYDNQMEAVVSHRSGETADSFIADLAVAMRAEQVKFGSLSRSERLSKYDRLLEIEEKI